MSESELIELEFDDDDGGGGICGWMNGRNLY